MESETTCTPCTTSLSMQALSSKEDKAEYCVVREDQQLEESYKRLSAQSSSPAAASMDIRTRYQAVGFLMEHIDHMQEDREIVGYAMDYLDRFVALQSDSTPTGRIKLNKTGHSHGHGHSTGDNGDNVLDRNCGKYCLAMYCLVVLDLSICLHAPTSGDALRNAVQRVSDRTDLDPSATFATVSNYLGDCVRSSSGCLRQRPNYPLHFERFVEEVQQEFCSDGLYHSAQFATLRRLSGHADLVDFSQAQMILIGTLDFYLHPVLPNAFVTDMLQFLSRLVDYSVLDAHFLDYTGIEYITSFALYQVELSNYSVEFINIKPSLIAFSAVSNVIEVMVRADSDEWCKKLSAFCEKVIGIPFGSKATSHIRHSLFRLWKESAPGSIQQHSRRNAEFDCDHDKKDFEAPRPKMSKAQDRVLASPDIISISTGFDPAPKIEACDSDSMDSDSSSEGGERKRPKITIYDTLEGLGLVGMDRLG